eukprot:gnl/TRDRNA2_/TRDRNA2_179900_c0_seq1.p1 gnl/TRDRNA2_/TRDRNA2_179900_c0~~gnl/TRDRNA2_/TRDRNA2_179900_c0_seq1.p1  ORF type:complete len:193 (+),score=37.73 gnl/TRDRNA2_/TRDRNA2_179900_c0_seq1:76-579(+)
MGEIEKKKSGNDMVFVKSPFGGGATPVYFNRKTFGWRNILHPMMNTPYPNMEGGFTVEAPFTPTPMRMYTDHRVMGAIIIPGASHVAQFGMAACTDFGVNMLTRGGSMAVGGVPCVEIKETLFERPFNVFAGLEIIQNPEQAPNTNMVCCRCSSIARELGKDMKAVP